jgi:hypothetical protein
MRGKKPFLAIALILAMTGSTVQAAGNNPLHASPHTFLFGNHIDMHQETKPEDDGSLKGDF